MPEFAEVFCPNCGELVALFDLDKERFENKKFFRDHLQDKHRFSKLQAREFVRLLENRWRWFGGG
ncbi:hypothetical protein AKJ37_06470 [candidate division MSBL1 archaeon SCGC-AAA259I09]|uniref:Uncharacterized protein n=5 Tax=candidate division MSBL1 TaxID=215777 RepID=A0A133UNZ6_9EURY|nr:hypothetical protein AKJ62_04465 [candidate division MSBL1 archaeon SCGC-AAA259D14]KXA88881.1 hypothetical protein AKJ61_04010 [candidate division MSBL1 archaeon SCGC-AAA259B11]KXA89126.1 hypothetical protein AKJ57_05825 [candidate division MSBL1 archaeon SCGC-AAA259A05]KXA95935.1 hypothetical protein AKJ37_06470 [candidate division MSBL1 archaeon SCGC-AAA259I09]KXA98920.1 hypothetical protein AKJ40_04315 [candidate division MSBL1 archaeon SCGC-AAA259M10]